MEKVHRRGWHVSPRETGYGRSQFRGAVSSWRGSCNTEKRRMPRGKRKRRHDHASGQFGEKKCLLVKKKNRGLFGEKEFFPQEKEGPSIKGEKKNLKQRREATPKALHEIKL